MPHKQANFYMKAQVFVTLLILAAGFSPISQAAEDFSESIDEVQWVMKVIPAGTYQMGCNHMDPDCRPIEWTNAMAGMRQMQVPVPAFYLAETETTWNLYQLCIDAGQCPGNEKEGGDNGWGKSDRPVIEISWETSTHTSCRGFVGKPAEHIDCQPKSSGNMLPGPAVQADTPGAIKLIAVRRVMVTQAMNVAALQ